MPPGSTIANEHWDDSLPVGGIWGDTVGRGPGRRRRTAGSTVPVFDPDDEKKLGSSVRRPRGADYYVLSSPRAWRTIGRLPEQFPLMPRFYDDLFAGKLGFTRGRLVHA